MYTLSTPEWLLSNRSWNCCSNSHEYDTEYAFWINLAIILANAVLYILVLGHTLYKS